MDDLELQHQISKLASEEYELERSHESGGLSDDRLARLRALEVELDRCWDLLRQRRARRAAGLDPDLASERPATVVEGYKQ